MQPYDNLPVDMMSARILALIRRHHAAAVALRGVAIAALAIAARDQPVVPVPISPRGKAAGSGSEGEP